jgi:hypothetical protein
MFVLLLSVLASSITFNSKKPTAVPSTTAKLVFMVVKIIDIVRMLAVQVKLSIVLVFMPYFLSIFLHKPFSSSKLRLFAKAM